MSAARLIVSSLFQLQEPRGAPRRHLHQRASERCVFLVLPAAIACVLTCGVCETTEYLQDVLHNSAVCDRCMVRIVGEWFRCVYCAKDFCDGCEAVDTHDDKHFFMVFKATVRLFLTSSSSSSLSESPGNVSVTDNCGDAGRHAEVQVSLLLWHLLATMRELTVIYVQTVCTLGSRSVSACRSSCRVHFITHFSLYDTPRFLGYRFAFGLGVMSCHDKLRLKLCNKSNFFCGGRIATPSYVWYDSSGIGAPKHMEGPALDSDYVEYSAGMWTQIGPLDAD